MQKKQSDFKAPQRKQIRSIDISSITYKLVPKANPYIRPASYRKQKSVTMIGTNAEIY